MSLRAGLDAAKSDSVSASKNHRSLLPTTQSSDSTDIKQDSSTGSTSHQPSTSTLKAEGPIAINASPAGRPKLQHRTTPARLALHPTNTKPSTNETASSAPPMQSPSASSSSNPSSARGLGITKLSLSEAITQRDMEYGGTSSLPRMTTNGIDAEEPLTGFFSARGPREFKLSLPGNLSARPSDHGSSNINYTPTSQQQMSSSLGIPIRKRGTTGQRTPKGSSANSPRSPVPVSPASPQKRSIQKVRASSTGGGKPKSHPDPGSARSKVQMIDSGITSGINTLNLSPASGGTSSNETSSDSGESFSDKDSPINRSPSPVPISQPQSPEDQLIEFIHSKNHPNQGDQTPTSDHMVTPKSARHHHEILHHIESSKQITSHHHQFSSPPTSPPSISRRNNPDKHTSGNDSSPVSSSESSPDERDTSARIRGGRIGQRDTPSSGSDEPIEEADPYSSDSADSQESTSSTSSASDSSSPGDSSSTSSGSDDRDEFGSGDDVDPSIESGLAKGLGAVRIRSRLRGQPRKHPTGTQPDKKVISNSSRGRNTRMNRQSSPPRIIVSRAELDDIYSGSSDSDSSGEDDHNPILILHSRRPRRRSYDHADEPEEEEHGEEQDHDQDGNYGEYEDGEGSANSSGDARIQDDAYDAALEFSPVEEDPPLVPRTRNKLTNIHNATTISVVPIVPPHQQRRNRSSSGGSITTSSTSGSKSRGLSAWPSNIPSSKASPLASVHSTSFTNDRYRGCNTDESGSDSDGLMSPTTNSTSSIGSEQGNHESTINTSSQMRSHHAYNKRSKSPPSSIRHLSTSSNNNTHYSRDNDNARQYKEVEGLVDSDEYDDEVDEYEDDAVESSGSHHRRRGDLHYDEEDDYEYEEEDDEFAERRNRKRIRRAKDGVMASSLSSGRSTATSHQYDNRVDEDDIGDDDRDEGEDDDDGDIEMEDNLSISPSSTALMDGHITEDYFKRINFQDSSYEDLVREHHRDPDLLYLVESRDPALVEWLDSERVISAFVYCISDQFDKIRLETPSTAGRTYEKDVLSSFSFFLTTALPDMENIILLREQVMDLILHFASEPSFSPSADWLRLMLYLVMSSIDLPLWPSYLQSRMPLSIQDPVPPKSKDWNDVSSYHHYEESDEESNETEQEINQPSIISISSPTVNSTTSDPNGTTDSLLSQVRIQDYPAGIKHMNKSTFPPNSLAFGCKSRGQYFFKVMISLIGHDSVLKILTTMLTSEEGRDFWIPLVDEFKIVSIIQHKLETLHSLPPDEYMACGGSAIATNIVELCGTIISLSRRPTEMSKIILEKEFARMLVGITCRRNPHPIASQCLHIMSHIFEASFNNESYETTSYPALIQALIASTPPRLPLRVKVSSISSISSSIDDSEEDDEFIAGGKSNPFNVSSPASSSSISIQHPSGNSLIDSTEMTNISIDSTQNQNPHQYSNGLPSSPLTAISITNAIPVVSPISSPASNPVINIPNEVPLSPLQTLAYQLSHPTLQVIPPDQLISSQPFGIYRLQVLQTVNSLLKTNYGALHKAMFTSGLLTACMDVLFRHATGSLIHLSVSEIIGNVMYFERSDWVKTWLEDYQFVEKIAAGFETASAQVISPMSPGSESRGNCENNSPIASVSNVPGNIGSSSNSASPKCASGTVTASNVTPPANGSSNQTRTNARSIPKIANGGYCQQPQYTPHLVSICIKLDRLASSAPSIKEYLNNLPRWQYLYSLFVEPLSKQYRDLGDVSALRRTVSNAIAF